MMMKNGWSSFCFTKTFTRKSVGTARKNVRKAEHESEEGGVPGLISTSPKSRCDDY